MAIFFHDIHTANFNETSFAVQGDGVGTVLIQDLSLPPFNITFNGVPPEAVVVSVGDPVITATAVITEPTPTHYTLTTTFSAPPPATATVGMNYAFAYITN
jgi:hypothetical protein